MASVLVKQRITQRYFVFDKTMRLQGWINKKTGETRPDGFDYNPKVMKERAFGGVHVISPEIFPLLEQEAATTGPAFSITPFYIAVCRTHHIQGFEPTETYQWFDVGKPETLAQAEACLGQRHTKPTCE